MAGHLGTGSDVKELVLASDGSIGVVYDGDVDKNIDFWSSDFKMIVRTFTYTNW